MQLVERDSTTTSSDDDYSNNKGDPPKLGNGQWIEREMAQQLNVKIFQVYRPMKRYGNEYSGSEYRFLRRHMDEVVETIRGWYEGDCQDMSECILRPDIQEWYHRWRKSRVSSNIRGRRKQAFFEFTTEATRSK